MSMSKNNSAECLCEDILEMNPLEPEAHCSRKLHQLSISHSKQMDLLQNNSFLFPNPELCCDKWPQLDSGETCKATVNPVRGAVELMGSVSPNPNKTKLQFFLGDPSATGFFPADVSVICSVQRALLSGKYNGYGPSVGLLEARKAVAEKFTTPQVPVRAEDVIMASGCSHALEMAIEALGSRGDNILVPRPGFPIYETLMKPLGIESRYYNLLIERKWEVDLCNFESLIDCRTRAIILNNPSNPCGAVFCEDHLRAILKMAEQYRLPIISDEIYGDITFNGAHFFPASSLEPKVPILTCDGISKRYLVPGWRLGWVIVHDSHEALTNIRCALEQLSTKIVGPCAVMQGALPGILKNTPQTFFENTKKKLAANACAAMEELQRAPGLLPVRPQGAMYMLVGICLNKFPFLQSELSFVSALIAEESVYCLPGSAFNFPGSFRLVLIFDEELTREACSRIRAFCDRHYVQGNTKLMGA